MRTRVRDGFSSSQLKDLFAKSVYEIGKGMVGRGKTLSLEGVTVFPGQKSRCSVGWVGCRSVTMTLSNWPSNPQKKHPKNKDLRAEVPNAYIIGRWNVLSEVFFLTTVANKISKQKFRRLILERRFEMLWSQRVQHEWVLGGLDLFVLQLWLKNLWLNTLKRISWANNCRTAKPRMPLANKFKPLTRKQQDSKRVLPCRWLAWQNGREILWWAVLPSRSQGCIRLLPVVAVCTNALIRRSNQFVSQLGSPFCWKMALR